MYIDSHRSSLNCFKKRAGTHPALWESWTRKSQKRFPLHPRTAPGPYWRSAHPSPQYCRSYLVLRAIVCDLSSNQSFQYNLKDEGEPVYVQKLEGGGGVREERIREDNHFTIFLGLKRSSCKEMKLPWGKLPAELV